MPLSWQQLLGLEPFPKVAGALGQLVQLDMNVAEAAFLTLLTRSELRRAMGAAARQRALSTFHPNVVMHQIEALFLELQERRQQASRGSSSSGAPSPQLDLVRTFAGYASSRKLHIEPDDSEGGLDTLASLPDQVRALRGPLWDLLRESLPEKAHNELTKDLLRKHVHSAELSESR